MAPIARASNLEFAPPPPPGTGRAWLFAGGVHALLFVALGLATAWKTQPQTLQAQAELWASTPQAAAPPLQEPVPLPEKTPEPSPVVKAKPPTPPAPDPAIEQRDAQIALEKKKQQDKKKETEKAEKAEKAEKIKTAKAREKEAAEQEILKAEQKRKALDKERLKDKQAKEKKAIEDKEREKAQAEKADAARADAQRKENMQRMQGLAGASGGENATGSALKSAGPSAGYAGRLVARIKPNITYPGEVIGNPRAEVEVKVGPDGTILSRRVVQSSGNKAWDEAVLRAIDKTEILPRDTDGRVPPLLVLGFKPLD